MVLIYLHRRALAQVAIGLAVALCWALPLCADGTQTGALWGTVSDIDGVRVQGVEVRLTGPREQRRAVTDVDGRFRFPALPGGVYELRAELLELVAVRQGITVFAGRAGEAELVLRDAGEEPAVEDWIQVVGEDAPLVDRFDTRVGANLSFDLLDDLPVERFYQSFALLLPGVSGGEDGNPNTSGALRSANLFLVDGVDTTDPTTGLFGLNLSYQAVQEVQVTTASPGVEYGRVSGAVINVVTRSGSRHPQGIARLQVGGDDFDGQYREAEDRGNLVADITAANSGRSDLDTTYSVAAGGPLIGDRLWVFGTFQDSAAGSLRPTLLDQPWSADTDVQAQAAKLTWQAAANHSLVLQHAGDDAELTAFDPFSRGPSELQLPDVPGAGELGNSFFQRTPGERFALERRGQKGDFVKLQWDAAFSQNLSLSLSLADQERRLTRDPDSVRDLTSGAPHVGAFVDTSRPDDDDDRDLFLFLFNGITEQGSEERPRRQANLALDTFHRRFGADHSMRFGVDYQETESLVDIQVPGADGVDPFTGRPVSGQLYIDVDTGPVCSVLNICRPFDPETGEFNPVGLFNFYRRPPRSTLEESSAGYWANTFVWQRWLIYLGVRMQRVEAANGDRVKLVDDTDLAPRLAVTYELGNRLGTVLSAGWGRFHEGFLHQYLDAYQRLEPLTGHTEYERNDRVEGVDCSDLSGVDLSSPCWRAAEAVEPVALLPAVPASDLEQSAVEELTLGLETRLTKHSSFGVHWVDRRWLDLWSGVGRFSEAEDRIFTEVTNLPQAERTYRALQVLFRKRPADRWQLLASYTWSEAEGNFFTQDGLDTFGDFGELVDTNVVNRQGPAPYDRPHQAGLFFTYHVPLSSSRLTLGSSLTYRDGTPFQFERLEDPGRRFVTPRGSERLSSQWQWDLAVDLEVEVADWADVEVRVEVRNVTDEQQVLGVETLLDSGAPGLPQTLDQIQEPRSVGLTLGLRF